MDDALTRLTRFEYILTENQKVEVISAFAPLISDFSTLVSLGAYLKSLAGSVCYLKMMTTSQV